MPSIGPLVVPERNPSRTASAPRPNSASWGARNPSNRPPRSRRPNRYVAGALCGSLVTRSLHRGRNEWAVQRVRAVREVEDPPPAARGPPVGAGAPARPAAARHPPVAAMTGNRLGEVGGPPVRHVGAPDRPVDPVVARG